MVTNGSLAPEPAARRLAVPRGRPLWTFVLVAVNGLVFVAMTMAGGSESVAVLVRFGAKYNPLIVAGQYWRLLTANFLHIGLLHLAFNCYALFAFGVDVEGRFGRARFLTLYLLCGLSGSILSFVGNDALSAGASGAIFGLVGAIIVYYFTYRQEFGHAGRRQLMNLLMVAAFNLIWGFTGSGIDNLGHIGGLLGGLALGWAFCPRYRVRYDASLGQYTLLDETHRMRAWVVALGWPMLLALLTGYGVLLRW
jgi:rhomboid protease GluP